MEKVNRIPMEGALDQQYNFDGFRGKLFTI